MELLEFFLCQPHILIYGFPHFYTFARLNSHHLTVTVRIAQYVHGAFIYWWAGQNGTRSWCDWI
jgi:hypothetical protein